MFKNGVGSWFIAVRYAMCHKYGISVFYTIFAGNQAMTSSHNHRRNQASRINKVDITYRVFDNQFRCHLVTPEENQASGINKVVLMSDI